MEPQLDILVRDRYKLVRKINEGGYGVVYEGKEILAARSSMIHPADDRIKGLDTRLGRGVAIKLEHTFVSPSVVKREGPLYASLQHTPGFPHLYYVGDDCEYYLLVLELLGPSLEDLFNFCGRCFSLKTVAMIVDQLINRLQSLHSRELVHRDFKPENLLMGSGRQGNTIFVIDLGITGPPGGGPMGTLLFASMKAHTEEEQSAFDDLESLGYMLIYFLRGSLPWDQVRGWTRDDKEARMLKMKRSIFQDDSDFFTSYPPEFRLYFTYLHHHENDKKPDYAYLRSLFSKIMTQHKYEYDNVFDWTLKLFLAQLTGIDKKM